MPNRTSKALLVFLSPLVAACDCPTGRDFRTRSTPGVYRASLRIEESGPGLPPGRTLVDEVIIHLALEPR